MIVEVDADRLEVAGKEARKALAALRSQGHPDGCSCKLCTAGRYLDSAYRRLEVSLKDSSNGHVRG